jgi:hypothetical protein
LANQLQTWFSSGGQEKGNQPQSISDQSVARNANHPYAASLGTTLSTNRRNRELRAPKAKFFCVIQFLHAALRGGVSVSSCHGSTAEAKRIEVFQRKAKSTIAAELSTD